MFHLLKLLTESLVRLLYFREELLLENLALHQQLAALKRHNPKPWLCGFDKMFWIIARRFWSGSKCALLLVTPETVIRLHRAGFRLYWAWLSHHRPGFGRKKISQELRDLIFRMVAENPS